MTISEKRPIIHLLAAKEIKQMLGISQTKWIHLRVSKSFPKPVNMPGKPRWRREVIEKYIKSL